MPEQVLYAARAFLTEPILRSDQGFVLSKRQSNLPAWIINEEGVCATSKTNRPIGNCKLLASDRADIAELSDAKSRCKPRMRAFR